MSDAAEPSSRRFIVSRWSAWLLLLLLCCAAVLSLARNRSLLIVAGAAVAGLLLAPLIPGMARAETELPASPDPRAGEWSMTGGVFRLVRVIAGLILSITTDGPFSVTPATVSMDLGEFGLRVTSGRLRLRPAEGSTVTIRAPKGAMGKTDPAAEKTLDLPGERALESSSVKVDPFSETVRFEMLGSAWRNPAGRRLYEVSSWGWLPWILSLLVLACAALARDFLSDRIKSVLSRTEPDAAAPGGRQAAASDRPRSTRSSKRAKKRRR
jgi:hypothetical protein